MPTIDDILLETTHAMDAIQLAMAYSASLNQKTQEAQVSAAAQNAPAFPPPAHQSPPPMLPSGRIIDTYA